MMGEGRGSSAGDLEIRMEMESWLRRVGKSDHAISSLVEAVHSP
jgi:hypothetical protein